MKCLSSSKVWSDLIATSVVGSLGRGCAGRRLEFSNCVSIKSGVRISQSTSFSKDKSDSNKAKQDSTFAGSVFIPSFTTSVFGLWKSGLNQVHYSQRGQNHVESVGIEIGRKIFILACWTSLVPLQSRWWLRPSHSLTINYVSYEK